MESRLEEAFGFWPVEGKKKLSFVDVPGEVVDELRDPKKRETHFRLTHRLIVLVDRERYRDALGEIEKWKTNDPDYNVFGNSCKHFLTAVAKTGGILIDVEEVKKTDWPEEHLEKLIARAVLQHADKKSP